MRKLLLSAIVAFSAIAATAQTFVATFDTLNLSKPDTFYVNMSMPGADVGFDDGDVHFPCVYDTSAGYSFWASGFAYSNMTDSVTSGFGNQYAAKTAKGYNSSDNYAVAYGNLNVVKWKYPGFKGWKGFYVTNSTYAYNSMRDGDGFAKKFGGANGNDTDWFKVTIKPYHSGQTQNDSVEFYLADFRDANNNNDYIVKDWQWVDLSTLSYADSLLFTLSSSDTGQFGMNTPAYFCIDNFTYEYIPDGIQNVVNESTVRIYPNPAISNLTVDMKDVRIDNVTLVDMSGRMLANYRPEGRLLNISTAQLPTGTYMLQLVSSSNTQTVRFMKQ